MEFTDICKQYFQAFQGKDIEIIEQMVHESVELKDWEIMVSGKSDFINANKKIFVDVENISIIVKNQGIQNQSTSQSVIVFNEIEIHLNNNSIILLVDQRDSAGQIIDFFNFPAKTQTGFIKIAKKYNMKIIPVENIRNLNNTFTLKFHAPINTLENQLSENELMLEIHKKIESWIIKNPTNWFLQHNRFN